MSAIANIVINDGKSTPASHTYVPQQADPNAIYQTQNGSVPLAGQETVAITVNRDKNRAGGINRVTCTLSLPTMEEANGGTPSGYVAPPKVAFYDQVKIEFLLPSRGVAATRKDLRVLASNLLLNAQVIDAVENLNKPY